MSVSAVQSHWHHVRSQAVTSEGASAQTNPKEEEEEEEEKKNLKAFWTSANGWRAAEVTDHGGEAEVGKQLPDYIGLLISAGRRGDLEIVFS